jgi:predicted transposase/invertase (TIGR01784 family)
MKNQKQLIQFDWAMKKMLRDKANFDILEGFLSVLLKENIIIKNIIDSESNKETDSDKFNRVDILVENSTGELVIIEIQNTIEYDYFQRILFGAAKVITEHISRGQEYSVIKKVISITIAYFDLGQGEDYVYHGKNDFVGIHKGDVLSLSTKQKELYNKQTPHQIFPEYYIIKLRKFDNNIQDKLDEWIYFLKTGAVQDDFTAKGLEAAKVKMTEINMSEEERKAYKYYLRNLHDVASREYNKMVHAQFALRDAEEAKTKAEEAKTKAEEAKTKAEEAKTKAEEAKTKAEEAKTKAEEAAQKFKEDKNKAEEAKNKAEEAAQKFKEDKNKAEEAKNKAEEAAQKFKEDKNKAEEALKKTEEALKKTEDALKKTEDAAEAKQKQNAIQIARKLKQIGMSHQDIVDATNLTISEIEKL